MHIHVYASWRKTRADTVHYDITSRIISRYYRKQTVSAALRFSGQQPASSIWYYDLSFVRVNMF